MCVRACRCVCVCVRDDCYCNANLWALRLNSRLQFGLLAFVKGIRAKQNKQRGNKNNPASTPSPLASPLSSVSASHVRVARRPAFIQLEVGGSGTENRGGERCLNLSFTPKVVYLALFSLLLLWMMGGYEGAVHVFRSPSIQGYRTWRTVLLFSLFIGA